MAMVCTTITEWIEEKISRPIEEWVERQEKKCKKRHWYDPRRWLCWLVTKVVKVVRWVVVNVVKAVVTIVCRLISRVLRILADFLEFLYLLGKALVTWDKCVLQEAFAKLADTLTNALTLIGQVLVDPFVDSVNRYRLRNYVSDEIDQRFSGQPDLIAALEDAFHIHHGVFGFRAKATVHRMFVDSRTRTDRYPDVPNLYGLHRDGLIDLYKLAGFTSPCDLTNEDGWYRPRPQRAKFPFASGGGAGEAIPPEFSRDELDEYIASEGGKGPHFRIYAIRSDNLDTRLDTASEKGRRLGLILTFDQKDVGVVDERYIKYTQSVQERFLIEEIGRRDDRVDAEGARMDLCRPAVIAVFGFQDRQLRGLTSNSIGTTECSAHNLSADHASGVTFIDDIPDELRRYVLIHELGHYFGLCHVDGFQNIMVSGAEGQGDPFIGSTIPSAFIHGGPRFTLAEAKQVWRFILTNFPTACLLGSSMPSGGLTFIP